MIACIQPAEYEIAYRQGSSLAAARSAPASVTGDRLNTFRAIEELDRIRCDFIDVHGFRVFDSALDSVTLVRSGDDGDFFINVFLREV